MEPSATPNPMPTENSELTSLIPPEGTPENVSVSAPEPQPIQPESSAPLTANIPSEAAPPNPEMERQYHEAWWRHALGKVADTMTDNETWHIRRDPKTGEVHAERDPSTLGEKWGRIAATALGGAAAGIANSQGPGGLARATAAGTQFGLQQPQERRQEAQKQVDVEQTRQLRQAQHVLLDQQIAEGAFNAQKRPIQWSQDQTKFRLNTLEFMDKVGGELIAHTKTPQDLMAFAKANPEVINDHMGTNGNTLVPIPDEKGEIDWYKVTPNTANRRNPNPFTYSVLTVDPKDATKPLWQTITEPAGNDTISNQITKLKGAWAANANTQAQLLTNAHTIQETESSKKKEAREEQMQPYDIRAKRAATEEATARANLIRQQADSEAGTPELNAKMMVDGLIAPSQLSKRAKEYNAMLPIANAYSLRTYGKPFNAEEAEARYRANQQVIKDYATGTQADQIQAFNQFLGHAKNLSNSIGELRNTDLPFLNIPYNKLRNMTGDPRVKAVLPVIEALRTEYMNFLNNNHALHETDIEEGHKIIDENANLGQMEAAIKGFAHTALIRTGTLNDRYKRAFHTDVPDLLNMDSQQALKDYGLEGEMQRLLYSSPAAQQQQPPQQQPQAQPQQQPAAVIPKGAFIGRDAKGNPVGYMLNGKEFSLDGKEVKR